MDVPPASEWIDRCSKRLQAQWRTVEPAQLDEVAAELWQDPERRRVSPEQAALEWLQLGVLGGR